MKKTYKITFDWWSCVIEFDTTKFDSELLQACLDFFSWEYNEYGDLYAEYAKKLAKEIVKYSMDLSPNGIKKEFNEEGMPNLDDRCGVRLIDCDQWRFDSDEFEISAS